MKIIFLLILIFTAPACSASKKQLLSQTVECLNYYPQKVQLIGLLYKKTFPGPPNYEDIHKGDKKEIQWLIKTTKDFCVNDSKDDWAGKLVNQSEVQLVLLSSVFDFYTTKSSLLGQQVIVKGTLFPQMSGHHRTQVLITVESLEKANE